MGHSGRICVLGAGGFLGSTLLDSTDLCVRAVVLSEQQMPIKFGHARSQVRVGNFLDQKFLRDALHGCEAVVHLISTTLPSTANENPYRNIKENLLGTLRLLDIAVESGVKSIVFASSGGTVYGAAGDTPLKEDSPTNPISAYGIGKLAIEHHMRLYQSLYGIRCVSLRISNPYGKFQSVAGIQGVIPIFLHKIMRAQPIEIWGDGNVVRDYVYADDVRDAIVRAIRLPECSGVYNIGSGHGHSINELISTIAAVTGRSVDVTYKEGRDFDVPVNVLDIAKARAELGWEPKTSLSKGIGELWQHYQSAGESHS